MKLSILIPTYNRAPKLKLALEEAVWQISTSRLTADVDIVVSDNASTDDTEATVCGLETRGVAVRYSRHAVNGGIDANMAYLYRRLESNYGWFLSDDDVLKPGAVGTVYRALAEHEPTVLLFSFKQPADCPYATFEYPESVRLITEPQDAIAHLIKCVKISIYVYRRVEIGQKEWGKLARYQGSNWWWLALGFSVLARVERASLAVISEVLATSDRDYLHIRFEPETWGRFALVLEHPYVQIHSPGLYEKYRQKSYLSEIAFIFAVETGVIVAADPHAYYAAARSITLWWAVLIREPQALLKAMLLRTGLARLAHRVFRLFRETGRPGGEKKPS